MSEISEITQANSDGIPWQVKAVALLGTTSVIALYLVYVLASEVRAQNAAILTGQHELSVLLREHISSNQQQTDQGAAILRVLRTNCVNQAKDNDARERCLR